MNAALEELFPFVSSGTLWFDPGFGGASFEPWWVLLRVDDGIVDFYASLLQRYGIALLKGSRYGPHISIVKGEEPPDHARWVSRTDSIEFRYSNIIEWTNGRHAWLHVWSPELNDVRRSLGLPLKPIPRFHLTIGRLAQERENLKPLGPSPFDAAVLAAADHLRQAHSSIESKSVH